VLLSVCHAALVISHDALRAMVAVRHAQLVDTESEPEGEPFKTEDLQSLGYRVPLIGDDFETVKPSGTRTDLFHSYALSDSTTSLSPDHPLTHVSPTRASFHPRTTRMTMRVQPAMSPGHSARVTKAMGFLDLTFHIRCRSSYETPSSSSSLTFLVRKRYRGTFELILDTDSERDELGDEDIEEDVSLDADDEREREKEAAPQGQQQAVSVVDTTVSEPLGLGYRAARHRTLESIKEITPSAYKVGQSSRSTLEQQGADRLHLFRCCLSPEWSSGSLPISPSSPVDHTQRLDAIPPTLIADIDKDVRELYTRSGVVRDEIFLQRYMFRSLEREQGRTVVMFGALWRPVLALKAWAGHVDTRLVDTSWYRYDNHRLIHDMLVK
nr:hypothetical protein [Tanacetum cinerariifolium]GEY01625.1 hypothetical protein [Tanacetum cinerariifolium]